MTVRITLLFAVSLAAAWPADQQRVLHFAHTDSPTHLEEIAAVLRSMTDLRDLSFDAAQRSLTMRGTEGQIALGEWLFHELDQPQGAGRRTAAMEAHGLPGNAEGVRVFFPGGVKSVRDLQELATVVRSVGEIRRAFVSNSKGALVIRGTPEQIEMADWLIPVLEKPAGKLEHRFAAPDDFVRVFPLKTANTVQRLQEITTQIRAGAQIPRGFAYSTSRLVVVRGTSAQIAMAERLIQEQDR